MRNPRIFTWPRPRFEGFPGCPITRDSQRINMTRSSLEEVTEALKTTEFQSVNATEILQLLQEVAGQLLTRNTRRHSCFVDRLPTRMSANSVSEDTLILRTWLRRISKCVCQKGTRSCLPCVWRTKSPVLYLCTPNQVPGSAWHVRKANNFCSACDSCAGRCLRWKDTQRSSEVLLAQEACGAHTRRGWRNPGTDGLVPLPGAYTARLSERFSLRSKQSHKAVRVQLWPPDLSQWSQRAVNQSRTPHQCSHSPWNMLTSPTSCSMWEVEAASALEE